MSEQPATTPRIEDTSPHDWKYVAEGGSTIVFSYVGPPHPQFDGTVLRLRKRPASTPPQHSPAPEHHTPHPSEQPAGIDGDDENDDDDDDNDGVEEPDDPTIVFQRTVIERLLPRAHLPRLDAVHVARAWLARLAAIAEPLRPLERRARDTIDVRKRKAVLATDLVGGGGWAVEIKPKWGFLPSPAHLSPSTRDIKTRTCRFCMHTHFRRVQSEPDSRAAVAEGYCPLDLYSGEPGRVQRALEALWDAWVASGGGVNSLRVFVHGEAVRPDMEEPASLAPLAAQLFAPSESPHTSADLPRLREAFTASLLPILLSTPVLRALSTLQRTLDALDVEGLAASWARLRGGDVPLGAGESDPDVSEWAAFVDAYLARQSGGGDGGESRVETEEAELRYRLLAYLLSASFKDCSIIVRVPPSHPPPRSGSGTARAPAHVEPTVTVIDLDVKPLGRLAKWAALDADIVRAYADMAVVPRACVDAHAPHVPAATTYTGGAR